MASRAGFSVERLQRYGAEAARKEMRKQEITHAVTLCCEYLGVSNGEDRFDPALPARGSLDVGFEWRITTQRFAPRTYEHKRQVVVRCDNLASRGVPFPSDWTVALQNLDLDSIAHTAAQRVAVQSGTPGVRCQMLGRPLRSQLSGEHNSQGSIVVLNGFEHVLCAHIVDEEWLAHRGGIDDSGRREVDLLQEDDLLHVDLSARTEQLTHKRVRFQKKTTMHCGQLREILQASPQDFDALVAFATYRAEEMRAQIHGHDFDVAVVRNTFQNDVFDWMEVKGKQGRIHVFALWTWHVRGCYRPQTNGGAQILYVYWALKPCIYADWVVGCDGPGGVAATMECPTSFHIFRVRAAMSG